ncbi:DUF2637 domain-containing protein [Streptomyces sp. NPDC059534]|uniref:DUF2637 domain-containing protein n=1 Tax=Streptomyces sp. NPDC059534 TaxID=3346859 RepID=UPI0036C2A658
MSETLTDTQTPATREAMAPASPDAAGATPAATPATPGTRKAAPPAPRKGGPGRPGEETAGVSMAPATGALAPGHLATLQAADRSQKWVGRLLLGVAAVGMPLVGIIGFAASYSALREFAVSIGLSDGPFFGSLAPWFPIGIDASIVALLALDLVMVRRGTPWPLLRFAAHAMTLVTVLFNATSEAVSSQDAGVWASLSAEPLAAAGHAVMPILFVLGVEAARRLLMHAARIADGTQTARIPLHRWVLSPIRTARLYRRMRLAAVRSYTDMVEREQALEGYRVWLTQELGGSLKTATEEQLLPMTMAPRGYTVEEALALPAKWKAEADERKAEEEDRKAEAEVAEAEREASLKIKQLESNSRIKAAESRIAAATRTAAARSESEAVQAESQAETARVLAESATDAARLRAEQNRQAAERLAQTETEAMESAEAAAARHRAAEDDKAAADIAATAARTRLETARQIEEVERLETQAAAAAARRAADTLAVAEATRQAATLERQAKEELAAVIRAEAAIEAAEDFIRLTSRERNTRRVARMLLAAHPDGTPATAINIKALPLSDIMTRLAVSQTTAGELRADAVALLVTGYTPGAAEEMHQS